MFPSDEQIPWSKTDGYCGVVNQSIRLPLARDVGAELLSTTLGGDPPTIPVDCETHPGGTLHVATR